MLIRFTAILACAAGLFQAAPPSPASVEANEPEWPVPAKEAEILKLGHVPIPGGGYQFEKRGADGALQAGVVVPGTIITVGGFVELLACGEGGKEHESILRIDCAVQALDAALLLSGFKRGPVPEKLGADGPQGSRVVALVQWKVGGTLVTRRGEDLIVNTEAGGPLPRLGWTFGAAFRKTDKRDEDEKKPDVRVLAPAMTRTLAIVRWNVPRDGSTILDNPHPNARKSLVFNANTDLLPPVGTPAVLILRAPNAAERDEIARVEKVSK